MPTPKPAYDSETDDRFMRRAIELARLGEGAVEPNPMVGCVLVRDGQIIGQGYHQRFGGPHAEIEALHSLADTSLAQGATAYVSLEPCCHHGKTPPCTEALIQARVARVVVAVSDPFPKVAGGGLRHLRDAGLEVSTGVLETDAIALSAPYLKRIRTGKPWVIAKWAMTIDGRIATVGGESQWITCDESRLDAHRLRGRVDAIAVGMGTVVADNPMLNARSNQPEFVPRRIASRVVFCRNRLPALESRLVKTAGAIPLLLVVAKAATQARTARSNPGRSNRSPLDSTPVDCGRLDQLKSLGAELLLVDSDEPTEMVNQALDHFGRREMTNVMVEGGAELLASFFAAQQLDECHVYLGAVAVGGSLSAGPIGGSGISKLIEAPRWEILETERFGTDLKVVYRRLDD